MSKALSSVGLSRKYCRSGAVNTNGSSVGTSWVATFQRSSDGKKVIAMGRSSNPLAHMNVAGMFRWAWVRSMPE